MVGNSGKLVTSRLGHFIDGHDVIVRMNGGAPAEGKRKHTGYGTDLWVFSIMGTSYQKRIYDTMKPKAALRLKPGPIEASILDRCYSQPLAQYEGLAQALGAKPTTGLMAFDFFSSRCEPSEINLVGFDFFQSGSWLHHTDCRRHFKKWGHDEHKEEAYVRARLSEKVRLH